MHPKHFATLIFSIVFFLSKISTAQTWTVPANNATVTATSKIAITGGTFPLQIGANTSPIQLQTGNPLVTRLTVNNAGKIGIGTTPTYYFHVQNSTTPEIGITTSAGNGLLFQVQTSATNLVPIPQLEQR